MWRQSTKTFGEVKRLSIEMAPTEEETFVAEEMLEEDGWEDTIEKVKNMNNYSYSSLEAFAKDELGEDEMVILIEW